MFSLKSKLGSQKRVGVAEFMDPPKVLNPINGSHVKYITKKLDTIELQRAVRKLDPPLHIHPLSSP